MEKTHKEETCGIDSRLIRPAIDCDVSAELVARYIAPRVASLEKMKRGVTCLMAAEREQMFCREMMESLEARLSLYRGYEKFLERVVQECAEEMEEGSE